MVSVVIGGVLLALSIGYYKGGSRYKVAFKNDNGVKIRDILSSNILKISFISGIGFSYVFMDFYFEYMQIAPLISLSIHVLIFLSVPAYYLGQTVPLLTNYFSSAYLPKITGKVLFLSTVGSFFGSILSTIVLMRYLGVSNTLLLIIGILLALGVFLSSKRKRTFILSVLLFLFLLFLKLFGTFSSSIEYDNTYNTVSVLHTKTRDKRVLVVNRQFASLTENNNTSFFEYVNVINTLIKPYANKSILVIGAGGFTVGCDDTKNKYTYIDIDPDLKDVVEAKFLKKKIGEDKVFVLMEIRKFLRASSETYDFIVLDAFTNPNTVPTSLVTQEFFTQIKKALNKGGAVLVNAHIDPLLRNDYSRNLDTTIRKVFPEVTAVMVRHHLLKALDHKGVPTGYIYVLKNEMFKKSVYTDDHNTYSFDARASK